MQYNDVWLSMRADAVGALRAELEATCLEDETRGRIPISGRLNRSVLFRMVASGTDDLTIEVGRIGSAIEMLHRASVIRDDIQDFDVLRRGRPTELAAQGVASALATADVLLGRALYTISVLQPAVIDVVMATIDEMATGQYLDISKRLICGIDNPFSIAEMKTGSLISLAFFMGASYSGRNSEDCSALAKIGRHLGTAFQLQNDINNVSREEGRGKGRGSDLRDGRSSSVAVVLRKNDASDGRGDENRLAVAVRAVSIEVSYQLRAAAETVPTLHMPLTSLLSDLVTNTEAARAFVADQQSAEG